MTGRARGGAGLAGAFALLAPVAAHASPAAVWWVESTCEPARATFEREVTLACEAVGDTCRVAQRKTDAELVARIDCSSPDSSWVLETQTADGKPLGRLELAGADDDRLREAAMEVARDAAPERTLAVEALKTSLSNPDGVPKPPAPPVLSLAASGMVVARPTATTGSGIVGGGRAMLGLHLHDGFREILTFSGAAGGTQAEGNATRSFRGGIGVAFGAPFTSGWIGTALEAGVDNQQSYDIIANTSTGAPNAFTAPVAYRPLSKTGGYVQDALYIQVPTRGIRPFAALTTTLSSTVAVTVDAQLGLAFAVF